MNQSHETNTAFEYHRTADLFCRQKMHFAEGDLSYFGTKRPLFACPVCRHRQCHEASKLCHWDRTFVGSDTSITIRNSAKRSCITTSMIELVQSHESVYAKKHVLLALKRPLLVLFEQDYQVGCRPPISWSLTRAHRLWERLLRWWSGLITEQQAALFMNSCNSKYRKCIFQQLWDVRPHSLYLL